MSTALRTSASLALRGVRAHPAKPTTSIVPFRIAAASISSSSTNKAAQVQPHSGAGSTSVMPRDFPLTSQEPKKGVMQYAL
ncbi:hypothetical protein N0V82_001711, partial [Gnomoniopsis sp. IMI 355080]